MSGRQRPSSGQPPLELTLEPVTRHPIKPCMCNDYFKADIQKVLKSGHAHGGGTLRIISSGGSKEL